MFLNLINQIKSDFKSIFKQPIAIFLFFALMIIPSIYAWFNIAGSIDPYKKVDQLKVAIVNQDRGASLSNKNINIGQEIVNELKTNNDLKWEFLNYKQGINKLTNGEVYAVINFKKDMSKNISRIENLNPQSSEIDYIYNEKINAIVPKITDSAANSLKVKIEEKIRNSFDKTLLKTANKAGEVLEENKKEIIDGIKNIDLLNNKIPSIKKEIKSFIQKGEKADFKIAEIKDFLNNADKKISKIKNIIPGLKNSVNKINNSAKYIIDDINYIFNGIISKFNNIDLFFKNIKNLAKENKDKAIENVDKIIIEIKKINDNIDFLISSLNTINQITNENDLDKLIKDLKAIKKNNTQFIETLNNTKEDIKNDRPIKSIDKIKNNLNKNKNIIIDLKKNFNNITEIVKIIKNKADSLFLSTIESKINYFQEIKQEIESEIYNTNSDLKTGIEKLIYIDKNLPKWEKIVNEASQKLEPFKDEKKIDETINILKVNPRKILNFLAEPVKIKTKKVFPLKNYGSAMTPFYLVLSIWVGSLVLVSVIKIHKNNNYTLYFYIARFFTFFTIVFMQTLIVSIGLLFFPIGVQSPILFIISSIFIGFIFSFFIYTLTFLFGDLGKGAGIVFLVLQLVSSGGTFPIEMMPSFFQIIHKFLPFTYAISLIRESIGGVVVYNYLINLFYLSLFFIFATTIYFVLNKILGSKVSKLEKQLEEVDIF